MTDWLDEYDWLTEWKWMNEWKWIDSLTQSIPLRRWMPTNGPSGNVLFRSSSACVSSLVDHSRYCCSFLLGSMTGYGAGAPLNARIGCNEGGNLRNIRWDMETTTLLKMLKFKSPRLWDNKYYQKIFWDPGNFCKLPICFATATVSVFLYVVLTFLAIHVVHMSLQHYCPFGRGRNHQSWHQDHHKIAGMDFHPT